MAAIAPAAIKIAADPDGSAGDWLAAILRRQGSDRVGIDNQIRQSNVPPRVADALLARFRSRRFSIAAGLSSRLNTRPRHDYEPRHVPQVYGADLLASRFGWIPVRLRPETLGKLVSINLVKACTDASWPRAAALLGLPENDGRQASTGTMPRITETGAGARFGQEIQAMAADLAREPERIDYAARRAAFRGLRAVPVAEWKALAAEVGLTRPATEALRRNAMAWIWINVTGSSIRTAPAFHYSPTESQMEVYRRFVARLDSTSRELLLRFATARLSVAGYPELAALTS